MGKTVEEFGMYSVEVDSSQKVGLRERTNSLFASNAHGGERAALYYSLVESCKLNGIDPFEYLQDVYNRLHDCPASELIHLLSPYWKPAPKHQANAANQ